ncbi:unnamed protein product [Trichobilharzia szidati]|nr:unnamed protein product [Trichobilharzia szidati]
MSKRILVRGDCKTQCLMRSLACDSRCKRAVGAKEICNTACRNLLSLCLHQPCASFAENYYRRYH